MKKINGLIFISMISILVISCKKITLIGEGPIVTQDRILNNYSGVNLRCNAELIFREDANYSIKIMAQQNILDAMITEVEGSNLVIRYKNDVQVSSHERITIMVTGPAANSLRISGIGNIKTLDPIHPTILDLDISGSGNINLNSVTTNYISANISGSGNIIIGGGSSGEEKLNISGSGNMNLADIITNRVTTNTSGSGTTRVNATQLLDVTISGSGSVYYKGNPAINTHTSGSGSIIHL